MKVNNEQSLKLKARNAPGGDENFKKTNLYTECNICASSEIRVIANTATVRKNCPLCVDAESAFLQTGPVSRKVYVALPF